MAPSRSPRAAKSRHPDRNRAHLELFLARFAAAAFDETAAARYGEIRAALEARGTPIGPLDTLIAAHALGLGATLVNHNAREVSRVEGVRTEDSMG